MLLLLAAGASARSESLPREPGRLTVELSPTAGLTVGDPVQAELALAWTGPEPAAPPRFPAWQETWGPAAVLAASEVTASSDGSGRRVYRQRVTLTAFRTGEFKLPAPTVVVPLTERTVEVRGSAGLTFEVGSVLPAEAEKLEPRPAAPLQTLAAGGRFPPTAALLAALSTLAAATLRRRLAAVAKRGAATALRRPLDELLDRLAALDPGAGGEPAHTRLSLALRDFLGRTIGLRAKESTTSELHERLRSAPVPPVLAHQTVLLLRDCDEVKFARREAGEAVTRGRLTTTARLAREIDEILRLRGDGGGAAEAAEAR